MDLAAALGSPHRGLDARLPRRPVTRHMNDYELVLVIIMAIAFVVIVAFVLYRGVR
jgi:hypothetical protein